MKYYIKQSFYLDGKYSGEAGREITKEWYNTFVAKGLQDHLEISGFIPSFIKTTEEIANEIKALTEELNIRKQANKETAKQEIK